MTLIVKILKFILDFLGFLKSRSATDEAVKSVDKVPDGYVQPEHVRPPRE